MLLFRLLTALLLTSTALTGFAQLQTLQSSNAQALVQKLVGPGVSVSNATITGATVSSGFFWHHGGTQLGLDSGIVLASGWVQTTLGFGLNGAVSAVVSNIIGTPGDPDLTALTTPFPTFDAVSIEFDFIPLGDSIEFNYVFSSEEYPEWICQSYNDVFAFFISGPGIVGTQNLARVPGTNIPVAINSINDGSSSDPSGLCAGMGPGSPFTQYYITNTSNYFTHDGHTVVLKAASKVLPCQTYHLKIAIADAGDEALDSGVFLEAGSLRSNSVELASGLPTFNGYPYVVEGCQQGMIEILRPKKENTSLLVNLAIGGNAVNGVDVQTIPTSATIPANDSVISLPIVPLADGISEGTDSLKIYVSSGCALPGVNPYMDSIVIHLRDYDTLMVTPSDTVICKNTPLQITANGSYTSFQWTPSAGLDNDATANPVATLTEAASYEVTAATGSCIAKGSVAIDVKALQLIDKTDVPCKDGLTGEISVSGGSSWQAPVQYNIDGQSWGQDSTFSNLPIGDHVVRIKDATGCIDSIVVNLVQTSPDLLLEDSIVTASCTGINGEVFINGSGGSAPYSYSIDGTNYAGTSSFTVNGGNQTLYIKDGNNCVTSKQVVVNNDPPISFTTEASPALCDGLPAGYLYVAASGGNGDYEYSSDGINFQTVDSLLVSTNSVTVTVRDPKGCSASATVSIPINQPVFVNAGNDTSICEGDIMQFAASYNANTITWDADPTLSATSIPDPVATPVATTTYYVTVARDVCIARDTVTVSVFPAPVPNAGIDSTICFGKTINLSGSGGLSYSWSPTTGMTDPSSASPAVKPNQTTSYYLEVTDINGCTSLVKDTVVVTITPPIQVFAGNDTFVAIGQPMQLQGVDLGGTGAAIFQWTPPSGLSDANIANPLATINQDITYTLKISTAEGCEGSDQITIKVYEAPEIFVPTGFTPNGDGLNDVLRVIPVGMKKLNYFKVYNRWGQMVFSTTNEHRGWDGRIGGIKQPTNTYVWIAEGIDYKGNKVFRKGVTTLIR